MNYEEFRQEDGYFYYIYKIVNKINQKFYIGQHKTKDINDGYMGSGVRIIQAIKKYGKENFEKQYLHFLSNLQSLIDKEVELVNEELISQEDCYNISLGGQGDMTKAKEKLAYLLKNDIEFKTVFLEKVKNTVIIRDKDPSYRKKISEGLKAKIAKDGAMWTGKKHTQESIEKMKSISIGKHQGESNPQYGTCWVYNDKESLRIKKEELDDYLSKGWIKGRKIKF